MKIIIILNKNIENLKLYLDSIEKNIVGKYEYNILDINNLTNNDAQFKNVIKESDLKKSIMNIISNNQKENYIITDENKFIIENFNTDEIKNTLDNQDVFCFSLSLGKNITHCANMNCDNVLILEKEMNGKIFWDWSKHYMDFGYPLNLDGTVFRGSELYKFIKNIKFTNTLELESSLQIFDNYPKNFMCAFETNKIIEVIFENKKEISNFNFNNLIRDRSKYIIMSKNSNENIN